MLPLLGYLSIPFLVPLNKLQNLIHVINKGSIIRNDWAQKENPHRFSFFRTRIFHHIQFTNSMSDPNVSFVFRLC